MINHCTSCDVFPRNMCLLDSRWYCTPFWESNAPKNIFGVWMGVFKRTRNIQTLILSKLLLQFQANWKNDKPRVGSGQSPLSHHFPTFFSTFSIFFLFSLCCSCFYLLAFYPFPFYQNSTPSWICGNILGQHTKNNWRSLSFKICLKLLYYFW